MRAYERFIKYAAVSTASDEYSGTVPSTQRQFDLGKILEQELRDIGLQNVRLDDKCYVYGFLPATPGCESAPKLGFVAHMDTSPDFSGENVKPVITENYDGGDVVLPSGRVIRTADFADLPSLKGRTLITADGSTLLGADDKAGAAEIITAMERIISEGIPHGALSVCITPDEEIGSGADNFDVELFGADFAYTVDGGPEGEIEYENFNASAAVFEITGFNVHPGDSKNTMINAQLVAMEINSMLPAGDIPRCTEGYEGVFHLCHMEGSVEKAKLEYIVRDHDANSFACREQTLRHIEKLINEKYGAGTVTLSIREQYRNMYEQILPHFHLIENAGAVCRNLGIEPVTVPVRGGTDGARLSYMGLPCPNLGTGGYAFHGPYEHITAEGMDKVTDIIIGLAKVYSAPLN